MEIVSSLKPVYALMAALTGCILVMLNGKRPNVREGCSVAAAVIMFMIVASMVPTVLAGQKILCPLFKIVPGVSVTLRVDAMSMIFALVASFLWIITVFYSMGYMRGLNEHAQTRFNACFALAVASDGSASSSFVFPQP